VHESLIITPSEDHVIPLRESFIDLCGGDRNAAYLLSVLEFWTNHHNRENQIKKRINDEKARRGQDEEEHFQINESLWVQRTREEISDDALGLLNKNSVTQSSQKLEDLGYIETGHPYRSDGDNRKYYRLRIDNINRDLRAKVVGSGEKDRKREENTQCREEERRERQDPETPDGWSESDWQYRYAQRWWERMDELGNGRISYTWRKKKDKMLRSWADAFDWVVRVREIRRDTLDKIIQWLFEVDDFWVPKGNLVSPTKFREKNGQGQWRVHEWQMKAEIHESEGGEKETFPEPNPGEEINEWRMERIVENSGATKEDFTAVRFQPGGEQRVFEYDPKT